MDEAFEEVDKETKLLAQAVTQDLVADFLYYDRKGDEELTLKRLEDAILRGVITHEFIATTFSEFLKKKWPTEMTR